MDSMGVALIEMLNKNFNTTIPVDAETAKKMADIVATVVKSWDYGYCPDCGERVGEPLRCRD